MPAVWLFDVALAAAVAVSLVVLVATLRQRDAPGAPYLAAILVGAVIWAGGTLLQRQTVDDSVTFALAVSIYVGVFLVVSFYPLFALAFSGFSDRVTPGLLAILAVVPVGLLVIMVTNVDGPTIWQFIPDGPATLDVEGPGFWGYVAYAYVFNLAGTVILLRAAVRSSRLYQSQVAAVVLAVSAPWLANVLFLFGPLTRDPTAIAFAVSGLALFYAMQRFGLLDIAPVARETLVDTIDAGMVVVDEEDRVLDTNAAFRRDFDVEADPAGESLPAVLAEHPTLLAALRDLSDGSRVVETTVADEDRYVEIRASPLRSAGEAVLGTLFLLHDVTERERREQRLRESEQRYRTLAENFPRGVVSLFDEDLRYYLVEGGAFDVMELDESDFEGRTLDEVHTVGFIERFGRFYEDVFDGQRHTFEFTHDGRVYQTRLVPVTDESGTVDFGMSMTTDITDREHARRELERQNEQLEQFASVVSHDLRNPLNVANSRVELARETGDLDHLDGAVEAHGRMDRLIDDILQLARRGDLVTGTEPVSLSAVSRQAWSHVEAPDATLSVEDDGEVEADRSRLEQLLQNCLHNAVKHGDGAVTVRVGRLDGDAPGFYVADDGPGIPPDRHDEIFDYGTTDHAQGTGLGLAIVHEIADGHGWDVDVTESETGGARFEFTGVDRDDG